MKTKTKYPLSENQYDCDEWKARREQILQIDGYHCKRCKNDQNLQVHHLKYFRGVEIWRYTDNELVTLCQNCHEELHHYKNQINDALSAIMWFWTAGVDNSYEDIMQIVRHAETMSAEQLTHVVQLCASFAFDKEAF